VLVNTSFNVRSEPIVCTPEDAFRCFMGNDIELLVVENCMLRKSAQNPALRIDYQDQFEPD
jgi:carbamoyltransferase